MAVPVLPDFTNGVVDTSRLGALVDAVRYALSPPTAGARSAAGTSVGGGGAGVQLGFDTEDFDNASMFAPTSTTITVPDQGFYVLQAYINFPANATGQRFSIIEVNGASLVEDIRQAPSSGAARVCIGIGKLLSAGDAVTVNLAQTSGSSLTVTGRLSVTWQAASS